MVETSTPSGAGLPVGRTRHSGHVPPALSSLPRRHPLVDDVYESLKAWVMDRVVTAGARVNIDAVARELEVSPTPVREALVRLQAEGFVVKQPARGYLVTPLMTPSELDHLYQLRLLLEPWAAAQAADRADTDSVARLRAELATCPQAPTADGYETYRAIVGHDQRFHDLVLELAGNDVVRSAFARTNCHLHVFRLHYGRGMGSQALSEHEAVVAAVASGRPDAAEASMREHLVRARDRLHDAIGRR